MIPNFNPKNQNIEAGKFSTITITRLNHLWWRGRDHKVQLLLSCPFLCLQCQKDTRILVFIWWVWSISPSSILYHCTTLLIQCWTQLKGFTKCLKCSSAFGSNMNPVLLPIHCIQLLFFHALHCGPNHPINSLFWVAGLLAASSAWQVWSKISTAMLLYKPFIIPFLHIPRVHSQSPCWLFLSERIFLQSSWKVCSQTCLPLSTTMHKYADIWHTKLEICSQGDQDGKTLSSQFSRHGQYPCHWACFRQSWLFLQC